MPKVEYSKTKCLVQSTGSGFVMAAETLTTGTVADPGVALTICGAGVKTITLADGTSEGQLKWFVGVHTDASTIDPANTAGTWDNAVLTDVGDSICLLWTLPGWVLLSRGKGVANAADAFDGPVIA